MNFNLESMTGVRVSIVLRFLVRRKKKPTQQTDVNLFLGFLCLMYLCTQIMHVNSLYIYKTGRNDFIPDQLIDLSLISPPQKTILFEHLLTRFCALVMVKPLQLKFSLWSRYLSTT